MNTIHGRRLMLPLMLFVMLGIGPAPVAQAAAGDWQPGPYAILDNTYAGSVDLPVAGSTIPSNQPMTVTGWVIDRSAQGWGGIDDLHIYDGIAGPGGTFLGRASFAQSRPDVGMTLGNPFWTNSGFVLSLAAGGLSPGPHTLTIYAHTPAKGWWSTQVSFTIGPAAAAPATQATQAAPVNVILQPRGITVNKTGQDRYPIKGYALDPNATTDTGIDRVDVYLDELRGTSGSKFIGTADLGRNQADAANQYGARFMGSGYQIDLKLTDLDPANHHIYTYARSSVTGQETIDTAGFNISK
jgi:hypothetical protein